MYKIVEVFKPHQYSEYFPYGHDLKESKVKKKKNPGWLSKALWLEDRQHGRVVKAPDSKSGGHCPRRFESGCCRIFYLFLDFLILGTQRMHAHVEKITRVTLTCVL